MKKNEVIFKSVELVEGIKLVSGSMKDSIIINVIKNGASKECKCTIIASDGKTESDVIVGCTTSFEENTILQLGVEFKEVISTLATCGDTITLENNDTYVVVKAGTSKVPINKKSSVTKLGIINPTKESIVIKIDTNEFIDKMQQGGFAFNDVGKNSGVINAIACLPYTNGDDMGIRIVSLNADGCTMAGSTCTVAVMDNKEAFQNAITNKQVFMFNGPFIMRLLNNLIFKDILIYITGKQAVIRDGNNAYVMTLRDGSKFPFQAVDYIFDESGKEYAFTVDKKQLKTAAMVAVLNATDDRKKSLVKCELKKDKLEISSVDGMNMTILDVTDATGSVTFGVNIVYLKEMIDHNEEKVCLSGINEQTPIYAKSTESSVSLLLPINLNIDEEDEEEEEKTTKADTSNKTKTKSEATEE